MTETLQAPFLLDAYAPDAKAITENEDGDLVIEGIAAALDFDREGEAFAPGAFEEGIKSFLAGQAPLLYHHQNDKQLGQVVELETRPEGLWMKAIMPKPTADWAVDIYNMVKRGMMKGASVRGLFEKAGSLITGVDLAEISITPLPVHPRSLVGVAQKAFENDQFEQDSPELVAARRYMDLRFARLEAELSAAYERLHPSG